MSATKVSELIADWAAQTQYEDLPRRVTEEAKNQVISVLAAVHAGYFSEVGRAIRRAAKEWNPGKEATIIPSGERVSTHDALFANCALAQALDYDDYLFAAGTGASSVLVPLALAEKVGMSGKDFITAQVIANEVEGRIGAALLAADYGTDPLPQVSAVAHLAGSALITAKLMDFDAEKIAAAMGVALAHPVVSLRPANLGSDSKILVASMSVPNGVRAAQLVGHGVTGIGHVFDGPGGLLDRLSSGPIENAFAGLGTLWLTDSICYKPYPGSATLGATIDCILELVRAHSIDAKKVRAVAVAAAPAVVELEESVQPYLKGVDSDPSVLNSSLAYSAAAALMDRELSARQFTKERVRDAATWDLAGRITLVADRAMEERGKIAAVIHHVGGPDGQVRSMETDPMRFNQYRPPVGARVRIELLDGRSVEYEQEIPQGAPGRMFDDRRKVVQDKFRRETRYTLRKEKMEKAIDSILHLDQANAASIRELVRLCCTERS